MNKLYFRITPVATCQDYRDLGFTKSGIYHLMQKTGQQCEAYCDLEDEGGGWIIFLRNNAQDTEIFKQDWTAYQNGFGDLNSNFWWGNEFLHLVTKDTPHVLKVDLVKSTANGYVKYSNFKVLFTVVVCCCYYGKETAVLIVLNFTLPTV